MLVRLSRREVLFLGIRLSVVDFSGTKKSVTEDQNPKKDPLNNGLGDGQGGIKIGVYFYYYEKDDFY